MKFECFCRNSVYRLESRNLASDGHRTIQSPEKSEAFHLYLIASYGIETIEINSNKKIRQVVERT